VTSAIGGNIGIPLLVEVLSYNMQKIECYILAVLLSICFAKTIHACMGRIVVQESHKIVCKDCMLCRAGYQVQPPCHPRQVYDEKTLKEETCVPCNDGEYKQASNRENNSLSCRPCNVSSCGNFAVLSPCTKTSPVKCSEKCKDGYHKNDYSLCVPISSSSTAKTRNTPTTWTEFTRTVHPKMLDINHTKSVGSDSHGDKSLVIDLCVVIGIVCLFLGFLVAYCLTCCGIRSRCSSLNCCGIRSCCNRAASGSTAGVEDSTQGENGEEGNGNIQETTNSTQGENGEEGNGNIQETTTPPSPNEGSGQHAAAGGSVNVPTTSTAGGSVNVPTTSNSTQGRDGQETADSSEMQPLLAPPSDETHF